MNDEYNLTQLKLRGHGRTLHRDYSAHFFRWSFARRLIPKGAKVLDVGCGQELPLYSMLTSKMGANRPDVYVGVDMNPVAKKPTSQNIDVKIYDKFNFVSDAAAIGKTHGQFTHAVCLEVIEHMEKKNGRKLLRQIFSLLDDGGTLLLSTPCYDGVRKAKNHIHEYYVDELREEIENAGFTVTERFGTFVDVKWIKQLKREKPDLAWLLNGLERYYDSDAMSCFVAPLLPDVARNNLWVITKEEEEETF